MLTKTHKKTIVTFVDVLAFVMFIVWAVLSLAGCRAPAPGVLCAAEAGVYRASPSCGWNLRTKELTFSGNPKLIGLSAEEVDRALASAAGKVSAASGLRLRRVASGGDLVLGVDPLTERLPAALVLAESPCGFVPGEKTSRIWLRSTAKFTPNLADSTFTHALLHAVGLHHETAADSAMNPFLTSNTLNEIDKSNLRTLYGPPLPPPGPPPPPAATAATTAVPVRNPRLDDGTWYGTTMARASRTVTSYNKTVNIHETNHMLHADERNRINGPGKPRVGAFHYGSGRVAVVEEPLISLSQVAALVPPKLKGYRFKTYFVDQLRDWGSRGLSLYVFDEAWCYYVDSVQSLREPPVSAPSPQSPAWEHVPYPAHTSFAASSGANAGYDGVSSCLEFSIYAVAHYAAVAAHHPDYLKSHPDYKLMVKEFLSMSQDAYYKGKEVPYFAGITQDSLLSELRSSPEAKKLRDILISEFDSVWINAPVKLFAAPGSPGYPAAVVRVVDGDTFDAGVDLGFSVSLSVRVRVAGVDCPEVHGATRAAGLVATAYTENFLKNKYITISPEKKDSFGRWVCEVYADGSPLSAALLSSGNAVEYKR